MTRSAIIFGATGAVGRHTLQELLKNPEFSRVVEAGRSVTQADKITVGKEKLEQKTVDFEKLGEAGLREGKFDVVLITLGTTKAAAGSAEAFEKIDREYVINAAKAVKSDDATHSQRLVYLSSTGASSTSPFLYPRSKGLTEIGVANQGYSDVIVFRPGYLAGAERTTHRMAESIFGMVTGMLSRFTPALEINVRDLGKSLVLAAQRGATGLPAAAKAEKVNAGGASFTVVSNAGALEVAKTG